MQSRVCKVLSRLDMFGYSVSMVATNCVTSETAAGHTKRSGLTIVAQVGHADVHFGALGFSSQATSLFILIEQPMRGAIKMSRLISEPVWGMKTE